MTIKKIYLNCTMYGKFKSRQIDIAICMEMVICVFIKFYIVFFFYNRLLSLKLNLDSLMILKMTM
uniref:Uncharacterized protein n=1 Tax=Anguilla anguilla TaxID=7936 RepID=A0A0E9QXJ5_ANGAN